jgi:hypothetical protein
VNSDGDTHRGNGLAMAEHTGGDGTGKIGGGIGFFESTQFRTGSFDEPGALGYKEASPGEPFIKIGIGLLEKVDEPNYRFWQAYKIIKVGKWEVSYDKTG